MSTANKSKMKLSNSQAYTNNTRKTTAAYSNSKIARDLRQQFDQYVLKQQDEESKQLEKQEQNYQYSQEDDLKEEAQNYNKQAQQQQNHFKKLRKSSNFSSSKKPKLSIGRASHGQNTKLKVSNLLLANDQNSQNANVSIPKSYLLAMQHLQDLLESKDDQISRLKMQLVEKEQTILESQERINQVLKNYHSLMDMYSKKQNEVIFLKQQMQQLRLDKQTALKQAAKFIQSQFKPYVHEDEIYSAFKQRSMSSTFANQFKRQPLATAAFSKQLNIDKFFSPTLQLQNLKNNHASEINTAKISQQEFSKSAFDNPFASSRAPLSQKSKDRDFISYQRQILRNQKQLIALKYRMQCLERKLSQDPKDEGIKQKIRKLSKQIQQKQKIISDLKKI